jgi:NAD(P)H-dependent nitrite reductase small subunit
MTWEPVMKEYLLGKIEDLPEGEGRAFKVGTRTVAVFRSNGKIYALANRCVHKGASICEGDLVADGKVVRCPWHNWSFDLATGENCLDRAERLRTYEVRLRDDQVILCA